MKINSKLLLLFTCIGLAATSHAQTSPKVKVAGVRVINQVIGTENNKLVPFNTFSKGSALALLVESSNAIIKFDERASKVDSFTDDKGTNLLVKEKGSFQNAGFGSFPKISEDGKAAMIEISGGGVPAAGAMSLETKGTMIFQTASEKKAVRSKPFEFKKGTPVTVGDIEMKVNSVDKPNFGDNAVQIEFQTSNKGITMLAGVKFFDASGKELESESAGSSSMGFGNKYTYGRGFSLKKAVTGKVIVEFDMWTDLKEVKVPFSIKAGVGG